MLRTAQQLGNRLPLDTLLRGLCPCTGALRSSQLDIDGVKDGRLDVDILREWGDADLESGESVSDLSS